MTGWRIGWTLSPPDVATAMADLQSQETSNPSSISQYAALAALEGPQECVDAMLAEFAKRRQYVVERIGRHRGAVVSRTWPGRSTPSSTSRSIWARSTAAHEIDNSTQWCLALLEQQKVATVMGSAFGAEGYARLSFATSLRELAAGFDRIEAFLATAK